MDKLDAWVELKEFIGQPVVVEGKTATLHDITSYEICVKNSNGSFYAWRTGTAAYDNAVANGIIQFVNKSLQQQFVELYEQYVNSDDGSIEAYAYYMSIYD